MTFTGRLLFLDAFGAFYFRHALLSGMLYSSGAPYFSGMHCFLGMPYFSRVPFLGMSHFSVVHFLAFVWRAFFSGVPILQACLLFTRALVQLCL